jgi:hypothetical protein
LTQSDLTIEKAPSSRSGGSVSPTPFAGPSLYSIRLRRERTFFLFSTRRNKRRKRPSLCQPPDEQASLQSNRASGASRHCGSFPIVTHEGFEFMESYIATYIKD